MPAFAVCAPLAGQLDEGMKFVLLALLMLSCAACEKKPTEEELKEQREKAAAQARITPAPKPGDWMWKDRKNPLEKKKH